MPIRFSHIVDIPGTDTFLTGGHTIFGRRFGTRKKRFERRHARVDEQEALVFLRNERKTAAGVVIFGYKEVLELLSQFINTCILHDNLLK